MRKRVNGCAPPYGNEQLLAWFGQPLLLAWFAVVGFGFLPAYGSVAFTVAVAVLWSAGVAAGLGCWLWCQLTDSSLPADAARMLSCVPSKAHETRYCAVCKKSVPGLDVRCWLRSRALPARAHDEAH